MDSQLHAQSSEADLPQGLQVGEYIIEGKIGEGGFGAVYRANHPMIGKLAAIKVLSRKYSGDPEIVSRFAAEARAVNQIRHRNIIDIFAFGQLEDGRSYYVMELLDGQPLDQVLDGGGAMSLADALPILRDIARALDAAHAKGIAHRDLKPENVFIVRESDGSSQVKLLDFGIAKLFGDQTAMHRTRTGAPIGTPYYMSPEQCRGQNVDHRTDIYSFGCVAYQLLTGSLPFEGNNHLEIMMKQTTEEPVPASQRAAQNPLLPRLPEALDDAIAWCMRKEPADRPPNLLTAIRALDAAAGIERGPDTRTPTPARLTPLPRRASTPALDATALAQTMAVTGDHEAGLQPQAAAKKRSRAPIWAGLALLVAGASAAAFVMLGADKEAAPAPAVVQPPIGNEAPQPAIEQTAAEPPPPAEPPPAESTTDDEASAQGEEAKSADAKSAHAESTDAKSTDAKAAEEKSVEEKSADEQSADAKSATVVKPKVRPRAKPATKPATKADPKPELPKADPYARH